jgi:hypothetical protein
MGFAREEILGWWQKRGAEFVDIRSDRFALRSEFDRQVRWTDVPASRVIRGLIDNTGGEAVVRVVTCVPP